MRHSADQPYIPRAGTLPAQVVNFFMAAPIESLPAVVVQVQGALTVAGNLPAFGQALRDFIARIPAKPATDQQFADAEAACKALRKAEDALAQAEDGPLARELKVMRGMADFDAQRWKSAAAVGGRLD